MPTPTEITIFQNLFPQLIHTVKLDFKDTNIPTESKSDSSLVTETDKKLDHLITSTIHRHFPQDRIMSEEGTPHQDISSGRIWFVDPICGTSNFSSHILFFSTNISLYQNNQPAVSFVVDYSLETYYYTTDELDCVYNQDQPISPTLSSQHKLYLDPGYIHIKGSDAQIRSLGDLYYKFTDNGFKLVNPGSSLGFVYAALGKYGAYICPWAEAWDVAAANHFITQSGGTVTRMNGEPWTPESKSVVAATDPKLHAKLLDIINPTAQHFS